VSRRRGTAWMSAGAAERNDILRQLGWRVNGGLVAADGRARRQRALALLLRPSESVVISFLFYRAGREIGADATGGTGGSTEVEAGRAVDARPRHPLRHPPNR